MLKSKLVIENVNFGNDIRRFQLWELCTVWSNKQLINCVRLQLLACQVRFVIYRERSRLTTLFWKKWPSTKIVQYLCKLSWKVTDKSAWIFKILSVCTTASLYFPLTKCHIFIPKVKLFLNHFYLDLSLFSIWQHRTDNAYVHSYFQLKSGELCPNFDTTVKIINQILSRPCVI